MTLQEQILAMLSNESVLDDDELAERLGVRPLMRYRIPYNAATGPPISSVTLNATVTCAVARFLRQ